MKRQHSNVALICGGAAVILGIFMLMMLGGQKDNVSQLTIGTYGEHIYTYSFNHKDKAFTLKDKTAAHNASYALAVKGNDAREYIYTVSEDGDGSGVYSFERGKEDMVLTGYWQQTGADPCFVLLYDGGRYMMTADYSGGSISAFPINDNAVGELCASLKFTGEGPVKDRQESSHIHQLKEVSCKSGKWILASDLGADVIRLVSAQNNDNKMTLNHIKDFPCPAGSGPRHMEFNKDHTKLYCIAELSGEVLVYDMDIEGGTPELSLKQRIQADEVNAGGSADIHIHPSGKWLYTSHRLDNDGICIFKILPDGSLEKTGYTRTGRHPRNFMITNNGSYLLVACRDDNIIQVYEILSNGELAHTGCTLTIEGDRPSSIVELINPAPQLP